MKCAAELFSIDFCRRIGQSPGASLLLWSHPGSAIRVIRVAASEVEEQQVQHHAAQKLRVLQTLILQRSEEKGRLLRRSFAVCMYA